MPYISSKICLKLQAIEELYFMKYFLTIPVRTFKHPWDKVFKADDS